MLRRRARIVTVAAVAVPAAAVAYSLQQERIYEASAEVLLTRQNPAMTVTGAVEPALAGPDVERVVETQASLARVPLIASRVLAATGTRDRGSAGFLAHSEVSTRPKNDILRFVVTDPAPGLAARFASEYARQYTRYRSELDTLAFRKARASVQSRLRRLRAEGQEGSALYENLASRGQQLRTVETLQTSSALVVRRADSAKRVQPKPVRNGFAGLVLGVLLGLGVAFLRERLDTRLQSERDVAQSLGMPLMARVPPPPPALAARDELVMRVDPTTPEAEPFRILRTTLEFANVQRQARTIMVTSALPREGKSTTVANLAVALARGGQRVLLVDLDLRRPYLDRFFGIQGQSGFTTVALGYADLAEAIVDVPLAGGNPRLHGSERGDGHDSVDRVIRVLSSGPPPPNPGEFVASDAALGLLARLKSLADFVLLDSPPLLGLADAITLGSHVDGVLMVARLGLINRHVAEEACRSLDTVPAAKLGFVQTGEALRYDYGYGYYSNAGARDYESRRTSEIVAVATREATLGHQARGNAERDELGRPREPGSAKDLAARVQEQTEFSHDLTLTPHPLAAPLEVVDSASALTRGVRQGLDSTVALVALLLAAPLLLLAMVAIRLESPGPVIFRQTRVGRKGREFTLYKLRGMYADARERWPEHYEYRYGSDEISELRFHLESDPRVTRVGRLIRRTSIDELPNLWNVLRGDMALVGPRPEIPEMLPYYGEHAGVILSVKPGVTSLPKVTGRDGHTFAGTLRLELEYVANRSPWLDLKIIVWTVGTVVLQRGVRAG